MERGDVRWYEFQPPDKRRPVLVMTRTSAIRFLNEVTVAPISSTIRRIPSEIVLSVEDGMPQDCAVNFDHLQTVAKAKIGRMITHLSTDKMNQAGVALQFALGIDE
jgi:mRNA interferase MazF